MGIMHIPCDYPSIPGSKNENLPTLVICSPHVSHILMGFTSIQLEPHRSSSLYIIPNHNVLVYLGRVIRAFPPTPSHVLVAIWASTGGY
jgi:hypothetical protein